MIFLAGVTLSILGAPMERSFLFAPPALSLTPSALTCVEVEGCVRDAQAGHPLLPVMGASITLPADIEILSVTITPQSLKEIPLTHPVEHAQPPRVPGEPLVLVPPDADIYQHDGAFPELTQDLWRADAARDGTLLSFRLYPVRYNPVRNVLLVADALTVAVEWRPRPPPPPVMRLMNASPLGPGTYSYLVIAHPSLIANAPPDWNLDTLCAVRERDGFTTKIVTTDWIYANYSGPNQPAQIRAFIQDAYPQWGVKYLLLVGTFDLLPAQRLRVSVSESGGPRVGDIPADAVYYGCLEGSYDNNNNGIYGERTDGVDGRDVDLIAKVMVGRFPVDTPEKLANMVRKTLRYENATPAELAPTGFIAERVDFGSMTYATGFMEEIRLGSTTYAMTTLGFANALTTHPFDANHTLYESASFQYAASQSLEFLNRNYSAISHLGHASEYSCFKINFLQSGNQNALKAFTNDMPYFIYSQGCSAGAFDKPNCVAEQFVTATNAAFAVIMNGREGFEFSNVIGGYSHFFHRAFADYALRGTHTRLGDLNEASRLKNLSNVTGIAPLYWRWVYFGLNLFGDPATTFCASINPTPVTLTHEPLVNTFETNLPYRVTCTVEPIGIYDPDSLMLVWTDGATVQTQAMTQVIGNTFEGFIPPHPVNTILHYSILARSRSGLEAQWPAPDGQSSFRITPRLSLYIFGSPTDIGTPAPGYGLHYYPDDITVSITATTPAYIIEGTRHYCIGFSGTGDIPQLGTTNVITYTTASPISILLWHWTLQHRLTVQPSGATHWTPQGGPHPTVSAPETITSNGTLHVFAEWRLDGTRIPTAPALSPHGSITVAADTPHTLTAIYLPPGLDEDGNGIADWWEYRYFGASGLDPDSDPTNKGFTLLEDFLARTNPLDPTSIPGPPAILHTPLDETQTTPGPFTILAEITDLHTVTNPTLHWRRAFGPWQASPLTPLGENLYTAKFGTTFAPGDDFEYYITASNPAGYTATTDLFFMWLMYPEADTSRFSDLHQHGTSATPISVYMDLHNTGNATLTWSLGYGLADNFDTLPSPASWTYTRNNTTIGNWALSTKRFLTPPASLHSQLNAPSSFIYNPTVASIATPPITLGTASQLSFAYWIHDETEPGNPPYTWDGGIVEISTNNGITFFQLPGPYTHAMTNWAASPWPADTPCFSGDGTEGWRNATFNLTPYDGQTVRIRFTHGGDNNTHYEGWYIDDLRITSTSLPPGFSHNIEPNYAYAIPPGGMKRILWTTTPALMGGRDTFTTVAIHSNDPVTPLFTFGWHYLFWDGKPLPLGFDGSTLTFPTVPTRRYTVESTPSLQPPNWQPLGTHINLPGDGFPFSIPIPRNAPMMFFRVNESP